MNTNETNYKVTKKEMKEVMKALKEYDDIQKQAKAEFDKLKERAIEFLNEREITEYLDEEDKVTYTEVISNRFDSTAFKKSSYASLYKEFSKETHAMRFTIK